MAATRLRRRGLCLHAELFEVQVSLDAALDVVADLLAIPQIDDRVALGLDHRVANGTVLDQLLLGSRGSGRPTRTGLRRFLAISGRYPVLEMAGAVRVLRSQRVDQWQVVGPVRRQFLDAISRRLRGDHAG